MHSDSEPVSYSDKEYFPSVSQPFKQLASQLINLNVSLAVNQPFRQLASQLIIQLVSPSVNQPSKHLAS